MKAMVYRKYGAPLDVLKLEEIEKPVPKDDDVLIRVHAASVNPLDSHVMTTNIARVMGGGLFAPKNPVPGVDVSGVIEAVGSSVTRFKAGDAAFGSCEGAFAEFACAKESKLAAKPVGVSHEQAAAIPVAGLTALQALRDRGKVTAGTKVVITGAAGGVGTFAVQIAKVLGADVTAVCSGESAELVLGLGAHRVIDYTKENFTHSGYRHDVIFDLAGGNSLADYRRALTPKGIYIAAGVLGRGPAGVVAFASLLKPMLAAPFTSQKLGAFIAKLEPADLAYLAELIESGKITAVIDRRYPLVQAATAVQYVREKRAHGKVIITVA
ncbi:MAG TPA: NAD(P)-dependent alcohol dehydrogenase [Pyrinomonadaceae bacterium]